MRIKTYFGKSDRNSHGTQAKGEPWNEQTVHGWKIICPDLLKGIKDREKANPEGGKTRARWYKRIILYFPSGAWWHFDIVLVTTIK